MLEYEAVQPHIVKSFPDLSWQLAGWVTGQYPPQSLHDFLLSFQKSSIVSPLLLGESDDLLLGDSLGVEVG
jgi:hypothetical protein